MKAYLSYRLFALITLTVFIMNLQPGIGMASSTAANDGAGLMAPSSEDTSIIISNNTPYIFNLKDFNIVENSADADFITIETISSSRFLLNGVPVNANDDIKVDDIENGLFTYDPDTDTYGYLKDEFTFTVTDTDDNTSASSYSFIVSTGASQLTFGEDVDKQVRGWRFFASPAQNETFDGLVGNLFTQGIAGGKFTEGIPNIYRFDSENNSWQAVSDMSDPIVRGEGFLMFVYEQDDDRDSPNPPQWPKVLNPSDLNFPNDLDFTYNLYFDIDEYTGGRTSFFSMIGNPKPFVFNFCFTDRNNVESTIRIWNPSANKDSEGNIFGAFEELSCINNNNQVKVAPYQSFLVNALFRNPRIEFDPFSYQANPQEGFFNEEAHFAGVLDLFTVELKSVEGSFSNSATFVITDENAENPEAHDAVKLSSQGFSSRYISLFTMDEKRDRPYALRHVIPTVNPVAMPLDFATTESGEFDLVWEFPQQLDNDLFSIYLRDLHNGTEIDMSKRNFYRFSYASPKVETSDMSAEPWAAAPLATPDIRYDDLPFEVVFVMNEPTSTGPENELPRIATLNQNYPNPFNPTTQIGFELPERTDVRLEVYNVNGQRIVTLLNEVRAAGSHQVTFDASGLSSGVYLYRLQTGDIVQTRKMMLLK